MRLLTLDPVPRTLAARQEPHVITQTIVRDQMTITTVVTLGTMPTDASSEDAAPEANVPSRDSGLSPGELGAILGSVAAVILILIVGFFCFANNRRRQRTRVYYESSSDSVLDVPPPSRTKLPRRPPPVAEIIPGGPRYPTYRALPIKNPRRYNPPVRHVS